MMRSLREITESFRASPVFTLAVLLTLGMAGIVGLMVLIMQLQPGFMGMAHFADPRHRTHDLTFGFLFVPAVVGLLAQFRRPSKNVAGILMALVPWVGLLLAGVLSTDVFRVMLIGPSRFVAPAMVITALLHPAGREFFRSFDSSRVNRLMLALVIIAAVPLLAFAFTNIRLQGTAADAHAAMGHYGFMTAFSFTVIGVGLLASLRPDGWKLPAWVAGLLPALLGLASLIYPEITSSLDLAWALAAITWGISFVAVAEGTRNVGLAADDSHVGVDRESAASAVRWVRVLRIIALIPVLLLFISTITMLLGGLFGDVSVPGGHTPPIQHGP